MDLRLLLSHGQTQEPPQDGASLVSSLDRQAFAVGGQQSRGGCGEHPECKCGRTKRDAGVSFSTEDEVDGAEKSVCMSACLSKAFTE